LSSQLKARLGLRWKI
jgi:hypothetical protein